MVEIAGRVVETTVEIFTTMVMMEVEAGTPLTGEPPQLKASITGMVGLAGTHKGVLAIHVPHRVAMAITANFLGMEVDGINEDVQDAIGEVANMLAGNIKSILSDNGKDIELSLPSTISGDEYAFQCGDDVDRSIIPFTTPSGDFLVELQIRREKSFPKPA